MILGGCGQTCSGMPKEAIKTFRSQKKKRYKVDFVHAASYLLKLKIDYGILGGCGQICPVMPKESFKTLISQKLIALESRFCAWKFIFVKATN